MKSALVAVMVVASLCMPVASQAWINIETVTVGDPANAPDTRYSSPGYGAVSYIYSIGKTK